MQPPLFSVVTASLNQAPYLAEAIESVLSQRNTDFEYIVVDGGSSDGSIEIIERYATKLAHWESQPDGGQSEALNRGFAHASGRYLTWLNSDDVLLPGALEAVADAVRMRGSSWLTSSEQVWIDGSGSVIRTAHLVPRLSVFPALGLLVAGGPSTVFRKALFDRVGRLDEALHYSMDHELWWRFYRTGERCEFISRPLMAFRWHEGSKTSSEQYALANARRTEIRLAKAREWQRIRARHQVARTRVGQAAYRLAQFFSGNYLRTWARGRQVIGKQWRAVYRERERACG